MSDTHAQTVAFVRETEIPPAPPPESETGVIKWLRANLFSGAINSILTILAILAIYWILSKSLPWILNGVWDAGSLAECRAIFRAGWEAEIRRIAEVAAVTGSGGFGTVISPAMAASAPIEDITAAMKDYGVVHPERPPSYACWAVLTERWNQLLFGFTYPEEAYWRPALAFLLLLLCAAPVLFPALPRKLLVLTAIYPFLAYFLIWGGSIWTPILTAVGFVIGYAVYSRFVTRSFAAGFFGGILAAIAFWSVQGVLQAPLAAIAPVELPAVPSRDLGGFMLNMILGTVCISLSLPIGIALALGRQSSMPIIKWICVVFIEFIRGVPLITLLFVANVVLAYFLPPGTNFDLILRVVIMITMFASAYIAEVVRGGLAALPRGQYEAADSLGLDYPQAMRLIILPQALKISIPGIVNVAVGLFKDTTLVSVISMFDLVGMIRGPILASTDWNGVYWELFGFAALLFFVVCYGISQYSQWLERQLRTDHR